MVNAEQRSQSRVRRIPTWAAVIGLCILCLLFVGTKASAHVPFSPYDEYVYYDYLSKVPTQLIVRSGEETGVDARNELACRGVANYGSFGEGCNVGAHQEDSLYPYSGTTGADLYSPVYFAITWAVAQPLIWVGVSLLDAGRLVGGLWLAAGATTLFLLLRRLRIDDVLSMGIVFMVLSAPAIFWSSVFLSTDAPTLLVGSGLALAGIAYVNGRLHGGFLILLGIVAVLVKVQNLAAVGLVVAGILISKILGSREHPGPGENRQTLGLTRRSLVGLVSDRQVIVAISMAVAAIGAQVVWLVIRSRAAIPNAPESTVETTRLPLSIGSLVDEMFRFIFRVGSTGLPIGTAGEIAWRTLTLLSIGGVVGMIVSARWRPTADETRSWLTIAITTLLITLMIGPALSSAVRLSEGFYFPLPVRYGLVLLPALVACGALFVNGKRWLNWSVLGLGSALLAVTLLP